MQHYYDGLEIRPSALREQQQLDQLNHLLTHVGQYCAGYSSAYRQRRLQDLGELTSLPLLNASELFAAQQAHPPFAGLTRAPARRCGSSPVRASWPFPSTPAPTGGGGTRPVRCRFQGRGGIAQRPRLPHQPHRLHLRQRRPPAGCTRGALWPHDTGRQLEALQRYEPTGFVGPLAVLLDLLEAAERADVPSDSLRCALLCESSHPDTLDCRRCTVSGRSTACCCRMRGNRL